MHRFNVLLHVPPLLLMQQVKYLHSGLHYTKYRVQNNIVKMQKNAYKMFKYKNLAEMLSSNPFSTSSIVHGCITRFVVLSSTTPPFHYVFSFLFFALHTSALDRIVTSPVYHCSLPYIRENGIFPGNMGIASSVGLLSK